MELELAEKMEVGTIYGGIHISNHPSHQDILPPFQIVFNMVINLAAVLVRDHC